MNHAFPTRCNSDMKTKCIIGYGRKRRAWLNENHLKLNLRMPRLFLEIGELFHVAFEKPVCTFASPFFVPTFEIAIEYRKARMFSVNTLQIGRAHVCTTVTNATLVCLHLLDK